MDLSRHTDQATVLLELAQPCCDGQGDCDGRSLLRMGSGFDTGDLALLSLSIPARQWQRQQDTEDGIHLRLWYVVVAVSGADDERILTGILSGEARALLERRIKPDAIAQMEPLKFTARNVCGGILHRETIKRRRHRIRDRQRGSSTKRPS